MDFKETRRLRGHVGAVLCARFTKDGAYALTAGADRSVKLWNPARGHPDTGALLIKNYVGPHAKEISQICVADDCSRFASVGGDKGAGPRRARKLLRLLRAGRPVVGHWKLRPHAQVLGPAF